MENFTNLEITINLDNAVCMTKSSGAFDSILAVLYFNAQKTNNTFNGDYQQRLKFLKFTDGVYHTSFPRLNGVKYYQKEQLVKSFDHDIYAKYGIIKQKNGKDVGIVNTVTGKNKSWFFSHERILAESITYYVCGDREIIEELLSSLRNIGKKSSLGWGEVRNIEVKEIENDYSLLRGRELMRNIPVKNTIGATGENVALFRLTHPYYFTQDRQECLMP